MNTSHLLIATAFALGATSAALADDSAADPLPPMTPMPVPAEETPGEPTPMTPSAPVEPKIVTPIYIENDVSTAQPVARPVAPKARFAGGLGAVKLMAGSGDFTQAGARDATGIGPSWDVRGVFGAHSPVGVEAAYVGSTRALTGGSLLNGDNQLMSNGAEGDLRISAPIRAAANVDVRPFAFGGLGWQYMSIWGDGAYAGADGGDNILTIPAGVGLELGVGALNLDVRGTYRHAVDSEVFGAAGAGFDDANALHSYNVSAGLGFEF